MSVERALVKAWYEKNIWLYTLLPITWIFTFASWVRRLYLQSRYQGQSYAAPVVVVGNISVGGNGKTPFIISLTLALQQRGVSVGVVSRGFGGKSDEYPLQVSAKSNPSQSGDEALLIARSCNCPVVVDPDRNAAVKSILAKHRVDLVLSDDGLQHYSMHRDLEIAVVDVDRGFGSGYQLPVGPMRESIGRLSEVDFVILNGQAKLDEQVLHLVNLHRTKMVARGLRKFGSTELVNDTALVGSRTVNVVAAIANPQRVADTLSMMGFNPILVALDDHQVISAGHLVFENSYPVIITAKDAVKYTDRVPDNLWVLEVEMLLEADLVEKICHGVKLSVTTD